MGKERDLLIRRLGGTPAPKDRSEREIFEAAFATYKDGLPPWLGGIVKKAEAEVVDDEDSTSDKINPKK